MLFIKSLLFNILFFESSFTLVIFTSRTCNKCNVKIWVGAHTENLVRHLFTQNILYPFLLSTARLVSNYKSRPWIGWIPWSTMYIVIHLVLLNTLGNHISSRLLAMHPISLTKHLYLVSMWMFSYIKVFVVFFYTYAYTFISPCAFKLLTWYSSIPKRFVEKYKHLSAYSCVWFTVFVTISKIL